MKNQTTDIILVLDRSGSMQSIKEQTISGFNEFLSDQKINNPGATITLVQFNHQYELLYEGRKVKHAALLNTLTYEPGGMTALLDAIGKTIQLTRQRHKQTPKKKRPAKVVFVIITDGYENSSTVFTRKEIFDKIRKMEDKQGWEFVYLGANQDAIHEAAHFGIHHKKAMTFAADAAGARDMFKAVAYSLAPDRLSKKGFEFTEEQREKQKR